MRKIDDNSLEVSNMCNEDSSLYALLPSFKSDLYLCKTQENGLDLIKKYYRLFMFNDLHILAGYLSVKECDYLNSLFCSIPVKGNRKKKLWNARSFFDSISRVSSMRN